MDARNQDYRNFKGEKTPFEGKYDKLSNLTCFGIIQSVNTAARTCNVQTIAPMGHPLADKVLRNVKTLQAMATSAGDEIWAAPPLNSRCVVLVVESIPFIAGFYNPEQQGFDINDANADPLDNRQVLATGDIVLYNAFTSRFIIRNFGVIEIQSTENCKTFYDPDDDFISTNCQNYELEVAGGSVDWLVDDTDHTTLMTAIFYDQNVPNNIAIFEVGTVDSSTLVHMRTGVANDQIDIDQPNTELSIQNDGHTTFKVTTAASIDIDASGNITSMFQGDSTTTIQGKLDATITGEITLTGQAGFTANITQDVMFNCVNFVAAATGMANKLGASAAEAMVFGNQLMTFLTSFVQAFNSHQHLYVSPGGPANTAPPSMPAPPPTPTMLSQAWMVS